MQNLWVSTNETELNIVTDSHNNNFLFEKFNYALSFVKQNNKKFLLEVFGSLRCFYYFEKFYPHAMKTTILNRLKLNEKAWLN